MELRSEYLCFSIFQPLRGHPHPLRPQAALRGRGHLARRRHPRHSRRPRAHRPRAGALDLGLRACGRQPPALPDVLEDVPPAGPGAARQDLREGLHQEEERLRPRQAEDRGEGTELC